MPSDFIRPVPSSDLKGLDFQTKYNIIKSRVKYADGAPLLLISTASLDELNSRLNHPVPVNRFLKKKLISYFQSIFFQKDFVQILSLKDVKPLKKTNGNA